MDFDSASFVPWEIIVWEAMRDALNEKKDN